MGELTIAGSGAATKTEIRAVCLITDDVFTTMASITDSSRDNPYYVKARGAQIITSSILIPSWVTLDLYGATIYQGTTASKVNVLKNKNEEHSVVLTNTTTTAEVAFTGHDYQEGQPIEISGANESEYNGVFYIDSVTDDDNFTYIMSSDPGGNATGTTVCQGDAGIIIIGGTVDYGFHAGGTGAVGAQNTHAIVMDNVNNPTLRDIKIRDVQKYAILCTNTANVDITNIGFDTQSDGVHLTGPCNGASIRNLWGRTGDDLFALTTRDWPDYQLNDGGDIDAINVDGLYPNVGATACVKIAGHSGALIKTVNLKNIKGKVDNTAFIVINSDNTALEVTHIERLAIENISYNGVEFDERFIFIDGGSGTSVLIDELIINNCKVVLENATPVSFVFVVDNTGTATIDKLYLNDCNIASTDFNSSARPVNFVGGTINNIFVRGGTSKSMRALVEMGTGSNTGCEIYFTDHIIDDCNMAVYSTLAASNHHIHCSGLHVINTPAGASIKAIMGLNGATVTGRLTGDAITDQLPFKSLNSAAGSVSGEFVLDQTATGLTPVSGDIINDQTHATKGRYEWTGSAWAKV